jgi:hypothetical protein
MQAITLRVSQLCEWRVFDLRRQLEEISMGNLIIPVYIPVPLYCSSRVRCDGGRLFDNAGF